MLVRLGAGTPPQPRSPSVPDGRSGGDDPSRVDADRRLGGGTGGRVPLVCSERSRICGRTGSSGTQDSRLVGGGMLIGDCEHSPLGYAEPARLTDDPLPPECVGESLQAGRTSLRAWALEQIGLVSSARSTATM